jgi:hypothetical protein
MSKELFLLKFKDRSTKLAYWVDGEFPMFDKRHWRKVDGTPIKKNPFEIERISLRNGLSNGIT